MLSEGNPFETDKDMNLYVKQDKTFWNTLANLANTNPKGLASLLGVEPETVVRWKGRLNSVGERSKLKRDEKRRMMSTGV